ncbi:5-hydroxyisourate hydrolase [Denticeps clupeoides]|uniref:5-hydroxyisourate hydrolase n=1 Tax=Denticeps clupeoides TaxID=299321 RepID=A0AAY4DWS2_9TELE|nr:5-hydroxyisourate hydrolase-like [Denticeps clupeoides]
MKTHRILHISNHILTANKGADMAALPSSPLSTHVLNTGLGIPAVQIALSLHFVDKSTGNWSLLNTGLTDADGRCPGLISEASFIPGVYKIRFETEQYWKNLGEDCFYPYVEIVFRVTNPFQKLHIPLLLSRFSYCTYRGS